MNWRSSDWVKKANEGARLAAKVTGKVVPLAICGFVVVVAAQSIPACSTTAAGAAGGGTGGTTTPAPTQAKNECDHPSPGCACSTAGEKASCGKVIIRSGDTLECSMGTTTCNAGTWSECDGSIKIENHVISGGGVALQGFGHAQSCGATNPCDPNCFAEIDTPSGIDGGAGITVADAGLEIAPPANLNTCNLPTSGSSVYGALTQHENPGSCTSGASDNCNYDYHCVGSACTPYTQGQTNTACTTPDFTLGLGCFDAASTSGLELEVCNRGDVVANTGTLTIAIESGNPTGFATGTCPAGSDLPTGPLVTLGSLASRGTCAIPLNELPIAAGECTSFNIVSPPPGINCASAAGGTIMLTPGSTGFAVVNPPLAILATGPLAECDACNNYTAFNLASQPTTTPVTGAAACQSGWCGVNTGSSTGGSTCTVTVTGQVMDPALAYPLPNAVVLAYAGSGTQPVAIPDEPGGTTLPVCDSCTSLISPGYVAATTTATNGTFTLSLPSAGFYTIVSQVGRWRRQATNFSAACGTQAIANNLISMPQARTGSTSGALNLGDIPKMALIQGRGESMECLLVKMGIDTSEIQPFTSTSAANRIDLYDDNGVALTAGGHSPSMTKLWRFGNTGGTETLNDYSYILWPCNDSSGYTTTSQESVAMMNYVNSGGRMFLNHWSGVTVIENANGTPTVPAASPGPNWSGTTVATWEPTNWNTSPAQGSVGEVLNSTPDQQQFYQWAQAYDAVPSTGFITSSTPREQAISGTSGVSEEFVRGWTGAATAPSTAGVVANANYSMTFLFNAPVNASAGSYCGRVVYNDMHVAANRGDLGGCAFPGGCTFPANCDTTTPLGSDELALEYQIFQLSACGLGTSFVPPTPPTPPALLTQKTFTRVFQATCAPGYTVKWGFFQWQDQMPTPSTGASITFTAATASGTTQPTSWPTAQTIGATTTSTTGNYQSTAQSVDTVLGGSDEWLQVNMTLNPNTVGQGSPVLTTWQQLFDCIP